MHAGWNVVWLPATFYDAATHARLHGPILTGCWARQLWSFWLARWRWSVLYFWRGAGQRLRRRFSRSSPTMADLNMVTEAPVTLHGSMPARKRRSSMAGPSRNARPHDDVGSQ